MIVKFINEAIALASCRHPHIVRVYPQVFQQDGLWCMVMEYVEGEDLADHLDEHGKFSEKDAIAIITKVGKALSYVHQQGFLHRDIKPANIMLRKADLSPVLIDFGLAREYTSGTMRSMTNSKTERYAPIEQYQRNGNFGAGTDVYALAATLYALLTERPPIPSDVRKEVASNILIPPKQHNPEISDRTNEAILKGMEIEPGDRPQLIEEWLELLKPPQNVVVLGDMPVTLQVFEFDTVKVDDRGEIIKTEHHSARYFTEDLGNGVVLDMIEIPGGTFMMGSPENEKGRNSNESPEHEVTVSSLYMAQFQTTQAQWKQVVALPQVERELTFKSVFRGSYLPVEKVSWWDAVEFCKRLSQATGNEYRLPSESEWEYACRARTTTPFYFGETITSELVNYDGTYIYANEPKGKYRKTTNSVGSFPPNSFGLYDMHGNVWEWCADDLHEKYEDAPTNGIAWIKTKSSKQVIRGGSWNTISSCCRSANQNNYISNFRYDFIGFRVVCSFLKAA